MSRIYVLAGSGTVVDFDSASLLMDKDLLQQTINAMQHERDHEPRWDCEIWTAVDLGLLLRTALGEVWRMVHP